MRLVAGAIFFILIIFFILFGIQFIFNKLDKDDEKDEQNKPEIW